MNEILVCMKAVPGTTQVQVDGQFRLQRNGVNLQWNVADESALEAALRLKGAGGRVTVLTMGPQKLEEPLRQLLGRGVDRAVLLTDPLMAGADTRATAVALAAAARRLGPFELILCGRRAMDGETGQVPGMLAGALGIECVTNVESLEQTPEGLRLSRRLERGMAQIRALPPLVVSICEYSYTLRLPNILSMRKARQKQVERYTAADLGLLSELCGLKGSATRVVAMSARFPGLRKGPRELDLEKGADRILSFCQEARL